MSAAGEASYLAGDYPRAALALGERPEVDVNLGLTLLRMDEKDRAETLFKRAIALSPALRAEIEKRR